MATIVCQGLQSCLESQVLEPRALRLRLSSPKPHFSQPLELNFKSCFFDSNTKQVDENTKQLDSVHDKNMNISPNADSGCSSFLQALSSGSQLISKSETTEKDRTYVHPTVKRSMSTLSEKSLELCTENLGSETGTDIIEDSIFSLSSSSSSSSSEDNSYSGNSPTREQQKSRQLLGAKKASSRSFPPPLTTISGTDSLQMRTRREDGRLIIEGIKDPSNHSFFQAERSHGRLRLFLFKDAPPFFDSEEEAVSDEIHDDNEDYKEEDIENDANCGGGEEEEVEEGREEEEDALVEENDAYMGEENSTKNRDVGGEMGMKKFLRPGRCKGETEKKRMSNWEPYVVATS